MKLLDIMNSPWAITEEKLAVIKAIYLRHVQGESADLDALEAQLGKPLDHEQKGYQCINGVAVICLEGPIAKKMSFMTQISGGTSTQILQDQIHQAVEDPAVKSILLYIDSPGGTVDGTQDLSTTVREARSKKPVCALADGAMYSAAYWIGSAADRVYLANETTGAGSIGVVQMHIDQSEADKMDGVKYTEITAGKYKRMASNHEPLSKEGRAYIQAHLDEVYSVFVRDVAKNRGVTEDQVLAMAEGQTFIGQSAIDIGLADGFKSIDELIHEMANKPEDTIDLLAITPEEEAEIAGLVTMDAGGVTTVVDLSNVAKPTDKWAYANGTTTTDFVITPATPVPVVEVTTNVFVETPAGDEGEKATEAVDPPQAQDRDAANGEQMNFEAYFREALGLAADVDLKDSIDAVAATQKTLMDKKGDGYVALLSYNLKVSECNAVTKKLAEAEKANTALENKHFKELRQRDADDMVRNAIASAKLTTNEAVEWGNEMAFENPKMFQKVIENRPEVITIEGAGPGRVEIPVSSTKASVEFRTLVSQHQKEARDKGKPVSLRDAQRAVSETNPSLYEQVQNESRNFNGKR